MKEPSCTTVETEARPVAGEGDGRLKLERESLESGRATRSVAATGGVSWRPGGTGTGEVGRLDGRKKDVGRRVYILGAVVDEVASRVLKSEVYGALRRFYVYDLSGGVLMLVFCCDGAGDLNPLK